jgi:hypothetical protein
MVKLVVRTKALYHKTPSCLRFLFIPVLLIYRVIPYIYTDQWIITGTEISSQQNLTIMVNGGEENKNYLAELAFGSSRLEKYCGKKWLWKASFENRKKIEGYSLRITEVPAKISRFFKKRQDFYVPCWVHGEIDISENFPAIIQNNLSIRSDLRRIAKNGLYSEFTKKTEHFDLFYRKMYLPFIKERYGIRAFYDDRESLKNIFNKGGLILIKKGEEALAGSLIIYEKKIAHPYSFGVKDGNLDYVRLGAIGALYYFAFSHFREKGYGKVNLGHSRAFLKDGVLIYKKKWNLRIDGKHETGFLISLLSSTSGSRAFLVNNPFICIEKKKINGAVFVDTPQSFSQIDLTTIRKKYYMNGMDELYVYKFAQGEELERTPK